MTFRSDAGGSQRRRQLLLGGLGLIAPVLCGPQAARADTNAVPSAKPMPQVDIGTLERWNDLPSRHIPARPVDVWLPPGFKAGQPYRVLCMHDGQMLFDARMTWNRQAWNAHLAVHGLMQSAQLLPTIVLGIWNREGQRFAEYFPEKALAFAPAAARDGFVKGEAQGRPLADAYLRFIVEDLLPHVESKWGPRAQGSGVMVAGASMGGMISLYALCEYPQVFTGAACLSTHWVSVAPSRSEQDKRNEDLSNAFLAYLGRALPRAGRHRIWVDRGDDALDSLYEPGLRQFQGLLTERGYGDTEGIARVFKGTGHNEADWSRRIGQALAFIGRG